jgi:hypothetical protein
MAVAASRMDELDRAEAAAGRLIEQRARGLAPKRTGRLASSVRAQPGRGEVAVASSLVYAGVIEHGWAAHGITAHPFLVPTAHASEPVWRAYYVADVNAVLAQVKGA